MSTDPSLHHKFVNQSGETMLFHLTERTNLKRLIEVPIMKIVIRVVSGGGGGGGGGLNQYLPSRDCRKHREVGDCPSFQN